MPVSELLPDVCADIAERARRVLTAGGQPPVLAIDIEVDETVVTVVARYALDEHQADLIASQDVPDIRGLSEPFRLLIERELTRAVELVLAKPVVATATATPRGSDLTIDTFVLAIPRKRWSPGEAGAGGPASLARRSLSDRELEVLQCGANGSRLVDIADELFISPSTVKTHFEHIYEKLEARDRAHAVALAMRAGWIR